jgi:ABC-type transport system substrate-binding protein/PKD repeat protein
MDAKAFTATRTTALSALFFVILLLGVPSFFTPGQQVELTTTASAGEVKTRVFVVGVTDLGISTLNPNTYTMSNEGQVIFPCYSTLLQYDLDMNIIGDLAMDWSCSPDGLTWWFEIVHDAYFCDPAADEDKSHPVTASDVAFSFWSIQNNDDGRLYTSFPGVIESIDVLNDYELTITLNGPFSTIEESWRGAPIFPEYYWAGEDFIKFANTPPIGSGAFYYATDGIPTSGQVELARNPIWYGETNHGWQIHVDKWILKQELNEDTMWLDVQSGMIDVMMGVNPNVFIEKLLPPASTPYVQGFSQCNGFVYEFNLNQMSDELRAELGGSVSGGDNNQLLLDDTVKMAMSYCVDKDGFVNDILLGLGEYADSLVPPQNPGHYWYPDPDPYDPVAAREMLYAAGWNYRLNGDDIVAGDSDYSTYYPLCKVGGTDPLQFEFITLDTDVMWYQAAKYLVDTTRQGGFDLQLQPPQSVSDMNSAWYAADYDIWLWDWIMGVTADAVTIMEVFTEEALGTDQDVYWVNETFDAIYYEALETMDPVARRELSDQLQALAYEMRGCQCVAYRDELYAVNTIEWDVNSLGDWNTEYFLLPDVWNWWVSMQMYPVENHAPNIYYYPENPDVDVGSAVEYTANAVDDDTTTALEYKWFWGDGTNSGWSSSNTAWHTYSEDGYYRADVAVKENSTSKGFDDFFMVSKGFSVTVRDRDNDPPALTAWSCEPAAPDTGTEMWFNATATDPEGDDVYYSWTFGDGHSLSGQNVRYQYVEDGSYTVTLSVDDRRIGEPDTRPVTASGLISVAPNHIPSLTVGDFPDIQAKQSSPFDVTASDADPRDVLQFTWDWGDGSTSVTDVPTADHTYNSRGTYTLTVYADDQTGLNGHNYSQDGTVYVISNVKNKIPVISSFTATDTTPYTDQEVTFTGIALDPDGDALTFTMDFGDSTTMAVARFDPSADNTLRTMIEDHAYDVARTYSAYLYVSDGIDNVSALLSIIVEANDGPVITPLTAEWGDTGEPMSFSTSVFDPDDDPMTYWWVWGDGTESGSADASTTHTYDESGTYGYKLYVNDGCGHNSTSLNVSSVNAVPTLEALADLSIEAGIEWLFEADAADPDPMDEISYTWDFGDGSDPAYGAEVYYTYGSAGTFVFSVTVADGFPLGTHVLISSATATVLEPGVNYPPEVTALADVTETVDELIAFSVHATDPNMDELAVTWNFGDGTGYMAGAVDETIYHAYASEGTYFFTVWVDDGEFNVSDVGEATIVADAAPVADAGEDMTVDEDEMVYFSGALSSDDVGIAEYLWTIEELSETMDGMEPTYTFIVPGAYTVTLIVTDTIGQTSAPDSIVVTVEDITAPTAVADADLTTVDMGSTVTFDGSGSTDNVDDASEMAYEWVFFDGSSTVTLPGIAPTHAFDYAGTFPVTLTVTDTAGNEGVDDTLTITVNDIEAPVAVADVTDPVELGDEMTMDAQGSTDNDEVVQWYWKIDFGATNETFTTEVATYTFDAIGDYDVTLTVWDAAGLSDSLTVTVTVEDTTAPVAVADADQTTITVGGTVSFDASDSSDLGGIASYAWDFGDDTTETGVSTTHVYSEVGEYTVTLTVTDMSGNTATATVAITVEEEVVNVAPTAVAAATPASVVVGGTVTFSSTGSSDSDGTIASYEWTIMSGTTLVTTLTTATATYTFTAKGTYTVTLNVTDDGGLWDTASVTVTVTEAVVVNEPPSADASASDTSVTVDTEVEFSAVDSSDDVAIETWTWTITDADGNLVETLNGEEVAYTFDEAGTYTVILNVTDAEGLYDTDSVTITVTEEDVTPDERSFIEKYGVYLGVLAAIIVVAIVAMMLLKKRNGGATGMEGATAEQPADEKL